MRCPPIIVSALASFVWSSSATPISTQVNTTLGGGAPTDCYPVGKDEINWSDCASLLHAHFPTSSPQSKVVDSWSYQKGTDRLLPLVFQNEGCGIMIENEYGIHAQEVGHWAMVDVNQAILRVLLDCGTFKHEGAGGERPIGDDDLGYTVRAYRPSWDELKSGGGQGVNVTEVS